MKSGVTTTGLMLKPFLKVKHAGGSGANASPLLTIGRREGKSLFKNDFTIF